MKLSFRRITSTGNFIPEIDGLRFIAISSVVLFHLSGFLRNKDKHDYVSTWDSDFWNQIFTHGDFGVPLFFVISGFILGKPFANRFLNEGKKVNLKNYFLRRLTRLEPPYIWVMTLLFIGSVYVAKALPMDEAIKSYFASITYTHNFIYGKAVLPLLNAVTWSLEVEVQFYILAPLMGLLFSIKNTLTRRVIIVSAIILFLGLDYLITLPFISLLNYVEYFLIGFLLADLYISKSHFLPKTKFDTLFSLAFLTIMWCYEKSDFTSANSQFLWELIQSATVFFLYYYVLFNGTMKILSKNLIAHIGGMCYTIYLLHFVIISMFGNPLLKYQFSTLSYINIGIYSLILLVVIMFASSVFFITIERPCMDKDWVKKLLNRKIDAA